MLAHWGIPACTGGVVGAISCRNGYRPGAGQLRGGIASGVVLRDADPELRNARDEASPDPRPEEGSPTLARRDAGRVPPEAGQPGVEEYIGALGEENWLEEWTFFGPESDHDTRAADGEEGQP